MIPSQFGAWNQTQSEHGRKWEGQVVFIDLSLLAETQERGRYCGSQRRIPTLIDRHAA